MAQIKEARMNLLLYDPSGTTITSAELKKAYKGSGGWGIAGDAGDGDPGSPNTIVMVRGAVSPINSDYYNWYADIDESYTYTLYVDGSPIDSFTGQMLFSMDLMQYIASNRTHSVGDGTDHSDVALNTLHRQTISGNPHSVTKANVGLSAVENKSASTIISEITDADIEALGFNANNQAYIYEEIATGVTTLTITEADINSAIGIPTDWYAAPNVNIEFWEDDGSGKWKFAVKTNLSIEEQLINGITCLSNVIITGLNDAKRYKIMIVFKTLYAPAL
jgi:hypothetical protein